MTTQRAIVRSLVLFVACGALAACYVQSTGANGANPGYGSGPGGSEGSAGDETRDHRTGENGGDEAPTTEPAAGGSFGEACGESDACADGLQCVRYYGIAGENGPEFSSCEMSCEGGCPDGLECVTISDGPGQVCRPSEAAAEPPAGQTTAAQGEKCGEGISCADGSTCIEYYGFAGPAGPKFASCEIRCGDGGACPMGQECTTISDGPGTVCRPSAK